MINWQYLRLLWDDSPITSLQEQVKELESDIDMYEEDLKEAKKQIDVLAQENINYRAKLDWEEKEIELEEYWNNKHKKGTGLYPGRNGILMDVRQFINPRDINIPTVTGKDNDLKANNALKWVYTNIRYTLADETNNEFWKYSWETLEKNRGDCEDGAILMYNIMLKSGIPYWRIRLNAGDVQGGGHAYITYLREKDNTWYVLDWCFVDNRRTTVNTPKGRRRFKDLKVGDEVISYNEKTNKIETSKIIKTGNRTVNKTYTIKYLNATGKVEQIECSEEHPFYVNGKWISANNLKKGQFIYGVQPRALYAIVGNHKKTKEWQDKITQANYENGTYERTRKRQKENNVFTRPDVRKKLSKNNCMKNPEIVKKAFIKRMQKGYKSQPELKFIDFVNKHNLPVKFVGDGSFWVKNKNPDFKVEGEKKVIEVTKYGYLGRDEKWARERQKHFEDNGFKCLIVFYDRKKMMNNIEEIIKFVLNGFEIINIHENHKKRTVWNIHCEGNNNYFVNGMLVHNCYWPSESINFKKKWGDAKKYFGIWFSWNEKYVFNETDYKVIEQ